MDDLLEIRNDVGSKPANSFWINDEGKARHIEKSTENTSDAPLIDHVNRDLEKAYEKDIERKLLREDELQAARDYMKVLLEEVEDCNRQLAAKNQEIIELKTLLLRRDGIRVTEEAYTDRRDSYADTEPDVQTGSFERADSHYAAMKGDVQEILPEDKASDAHDPVQSTEESDIPSENVSDDGTGSGEIRDISEKTAQTLNKKQGSKGAAFVMILELLLILALVVALVVSKGWFGRKNWDRSGDQTEQNDPAADTAENTDKNSSAGTVRYLNDLTSVAAAADTDLNGYVCKVTTIDGLEYLTFSSKDNSVSYKNEYYPGDMSFRKTVVVERGGERISFSKGYDLSQDLSLLCPENVDIGGESFLLFTDSTDGADGISSYMRLVSKESLASYVSSDITRQIADCFKAGLLQGQQGTQSNPSVLGITVNGRVYKFAIPAGYYDTLLFGGQKLPFITPSFAMTGDKELGWAGVVSVGDGMYIGYAEGSFEVSMGQIRAVCDSFRPYVTPDKADLSGERAIEALSYVPEKTVAACDVYGNEYLVPFVPEAEGPIYSSLNRDDSDPDDLIFRDDDGNSVSYRGIDVSKYHGTIDWQTVSESGIDFAMIRMGYRGMNAGALETDDNFRSNISEADLYGINVGVYFVSQAVNEKEAIEEAEYVINSVRGYNISYPIVIDMEYVSTYTARANDISADARTKACVAFCKKILDAGYKPMVAADSAYLLLGMNIAELNGIDIRYIQNDNGAAYPYSYTMLRYSSEGQIPGVPEKCGLDVSFVDYSAER